MLIVVRLKANDTFLETSGLKFTLSQHSALGEENGNYVYNFTIPYTSVNAEAFGFPRRLTMFAVANATIRGSIFGNGILLKEGIWTAKSTNGVTINISMYIESSIFNVMAHDIKLPQVFDLSFTYNDIVGHVVSQVSQSFPGVNHNFPCIHNPSFYGEGEDKANPDFQGIINDFHAGSLYIRSMNNNALVPQLYLLYIVQRIFDYFGYSVSGKVFADPRWCSALLYNNFALDRLVPSRFTGALSTFHPVYFDWVLVWDENIVDPGGHYDASTGRYHVDSVGNYEIAVYLKHKPPSLPTTAETGRFELWYGSSMIYSYMQLYPFGTHDYFTLNKIHTEYIAYADIGQDLYAKFMYLDQDGNPVECLIMEGDISIQNKDSVENNKFLNVINYRNHVPNMEVKRFLESFYSSTKLIPFFNNTYKTVVLVSISELLGSNAQVSFNSGILKDTLRVISNTYNGVTFSFDFQGEDKNLDNNFLDISNAQIRGEVDYYGLLPAVASEGEIYFIRSLHAYYIYTVLEEVDGVNTYGWKRYSHAYNPWVVDEGEESESFPMAPMLMQSVDCPRDGWSTRRDLPSYDGKGTSAAYGFATEFALRIMFYHGFVADAKDPYPLASTTTMDGEGNRVSDINWTPKELVPLYFPLYLKWLKRRVEVEFERLIDYVDIASFDFRVAANIEGALILFQSVLTKLDAKKSPIGKFRGWTK